MSNYSEISLLLERLKPIIDNQIVRHPAVKSAIKAKNGTIISVNTTNKTAVVIFPFDSTPIILPYNPKVESYLTTGEAKGKQVSVWYYQTIQNGVIMQNKDWNLAGGDISAILIQDIQTKLEFFSNNHSICIRFDNISPASIFGGTWVLIKDRMLLSAGGKYALGGIGGEETHTLTINEMPLHNHIMNNTLQYNHNTVWNLQNVGTRNDNFQGANYSTGNTGGNQPHNNMPPYLAVNIWVRDDDNTIGGLI